MIDGSVHGSARQPVIPPRFLILTGAALAALIAIMAYSSFASLTRRPESGAVTAPGSASSRVASSASQVDVGGGVTVRITWTALEPELVFDVSMDTHSVDLDPYDLSRMAVLHTDDGRESAVLSWDAPMGGHHRKGRLVFSGAATGGEPLIAATTKSVELVIYELSGVPARSFTWELK